jgi:hypothetical protein
MKVVVPLAGPDFIETEARTKAETLVRGEPLLPWVLRQRPWARDGKVTSSDYVFVLHDNAVCRAFAEDTLSAWYPGSSQVFISRHARGAALSALAGVSVLGQLRGETVIIDLADIQFDLDLDPDQVFSDNPDVAAIALAFTSTSPIYSYFRTDPGGLVVEAREKQVISDIASAGVYIYRDAACYMAALSYCLDQGSEFTHNGLNYVCPVYNGAVAAGRSVFLVSVEGVEDIKVG